jgi:hypothetical protein
VHTVPEVLFGRQCPIIGITERRGCSIVKNAMSGVAQIEAEFGTDFVDVHAGFVEKCIAYVTFLTFFILKTAVTIYPPRY